MKEDNEIGVPYVEDQINIELLKDVPKKKLDRLLAMSREELIIKVDALEHNIDCLLMELREEL